MRIWKWTLEATDTQAISMPKNAQLLSVQMQNGSPQLWALVDPEMSYENRVIAIYGTGNPVPDEPGQYISTFQMHGGQLVFHAFALER